MLHKIGVALIAPTLVAAPGLAIETQPPATSLSAKPQQASTSESKIKSEIQAESGVASRPAKNSMPAGDTGPVAPRSVPMPGLY
jgi:hypothetical protein